MCGNVKDIRAWIEMSNCFEVMGQLRKQGVLTKADQQKAMTMTRAQWITFMTEKVGLEPRT